MQPPFLFCFRTGERQEPDKCESSWGLVFTYINKYCITHKAVLKNKQISGGMSSSYKKQAAAYMYNTANLRKIRRQETRFCLDVCWYKSK